MLARPRVVLLASMGPRDESRGKPARSDRPAEAHPGFNGTSRRVARKGTFQSIFTSSTSTLQWDLATNREERIWTRPGCASTCELQWDLATNREERGRQQAGSGRFNGFNGTSRRIARKAAYRCHRAPPSGCFNGTSRRIARKVALLADLADQLVGFNGTSRRIARKVISGHVLNSRRGRLQWDLATNREESGKRMPPSRFPSRASMGPRDESRGKARGRVEELAACRLQWDLATNREERRQGADGTRAQGHASMGPRDESRGKPARIPPPPCEQRLQWDLATNREESAQFDVAPLQRYGLQWDLATNREERHGRSSATSSGSSFNGTSRRIARKAGDQSPVCHQRLASMGPRDESRGKVLFSSSRMGAF